MKIVEECFRLIILLVINPIKNILKHGRTAFKFPKSMGSKSYMKKIPLKK